MNYNKNQLLEDYTHFLKFMDFNEEQIKFIIKQREVYDILRKEKEFHYDTYERDMWYTMNRSGLFEREKSNKSQIYSWNPSHTRMFITETNYEL